MKTLLIEHMGAASKLEGQVVSQITSKVLYEVAGIVETVEGMVVRFDNVIGRILNAKDHQKLTHNIDRIIERLEDPQRKLNTLMDELKQTEDDTTEQDTDSTLYDQHCIIRLAAGYRF